MKQYIQLLDNYCTLHLILKAFTLTTNLSTAFLEKVYKKIAPFSIYFLIVALVSHLANIFHQIINIFIEFIGIIFFASKLISSFDIWSVFNYLGTNFNSSSTIF